MAYWNAPAGYGYSSVGGFPSTFRGNLGNYGGYTGLAGGGYAPAYAGSYGFDLGRRYGYGNGGYGLPGPNAGVYGTYQSAYAGNAVPTWGGYGYGASTVSGPVASTVTPFSPVGFNPAATPLGLPAPLGQPAALPASAVQEKLQTAVTTAAVAANSQAQLAASREQEAALSVLRKFPQFPVGSGPQLATATPPPPPVFAPTVTAATVTASPWGAPFGAPAFTPFW